MTEMYEIIFLKLNVTKCQNSRFSTNIFVILLSIRCNIVAVNLY